MSLGGGTRETSPDQGERRTSAIFSGSRLIDILSRVRDGVAVVRDPDSGAIGLDPDLHRDPRTPEDPILDRLGILPPLYPEWLGDRSFLDAHKVRFPYVVGEMATAIASPDLVIAGARAGFLSFFGAAGLGLDAVEAGITRIARTLDPAGMSWGSNLIHSPAEPDMEQAVVACYLRNDVRRVSASAFMALSPAVVRFAASGLRLELSGRIARRRHVFAKISRPEIAAQFLAPPPEEMLDSLVAAGSLTRAEARLARRLPVAEDITVEADSGGHTDNRPLVSLFPVIAELRDRLAERYAYGRPIRIGAAGGIGTPQAAACAFALGAAYILTGSINQAATEAGTSAAAKAMLARAELSDVTMAPAADMFELGVKVQVLRRGTLFASRAAWLHGIFTTADSLDELAPATMARLEKEIFQASLEQVWDQCLRFWTNRDPRQIARAARDPKHRMALVFRWYLGGGSRWAIAGEATRLMDYQIWCGPAMGAFNAWAEGSFLANPANRTIAQLGLNLLEGAAVATRAQQARSYGVPVPAAAFRFRPRPMAERPAS